MYAQYVTEDLSHSDELGEALSGERKGMEATMNGKAIEAYRKKNGGKYKSRY